jgi:hypothetical protein
MSEKRVINTTPWIPLLPLRFLGLSLRQCVALGHQALLSPLASSLGLCTLGVHLLLENPLALLLGLGFVNLL